MKLMLLGISFTLDMTVLKKKFMLPSKEVKPIFKSKQSQEFNTTLIQQALLSKSVLPLISTILSMVTIMVSISNMDLPLSWIALTKSKL